MLRLLFDIAAPAGMIGASNFFELAVAVAIALFGTTPTAALATTVGVLAKEEHSQIVFFQKNLKNKMLRAPNCPLVLFVGAKKLVKRKSLRILSTHSCKSNRKQADLTRKSLRMKGRCVIMNWLADARYEDRHNDVFIDTDMTVDTWFESHPGLATYSSGPEIEIGPELAR